MKPYKRWQYGCGYASHEEMYRDILEYGWRNVTKEILEEVEGKGEALLKEREYILKFRSNEPEYGYNRHINDNTLGIRKPRPSRKKGLVQCVETKETFDSAEAAGRAYGISGQSIRHAIEYQSLCVGFHWTRLAPLT